MIQIDYQDKRPIYEQVAERFKQLIVRGILKPDEKLPSVRSLAIDLSINPNTIQKAYQELDRTGFTYSVKGRGNFIAPETSWKQDASEESLLKLKELLRELEALGQSGDEIINIVREEVIKL